MDDNETEFKERLAKEQGYRDYKRANTPNYQNPTYWVMIVIVNIVGYFLFIR